MRLHCVLRSGGEYGPEHVIRLRDQLREHTPGVTLVCLSDVVVDGVETQVLQTELPGWWAKMELFAPWTQGRVLHYVDLDVTVTGDVSPLLEIRDRLTIMRDVYRPDGLQSAVMVLTEEMRSEIWLSFVSAARDHMRRHRMGGDQAFLETRLLDRADRLQDVLPGFLESYKASVRGRGRPQPETRLVVFHGRPRPWEVSW